MCLLERRFRRHRASTGSHRFDAKKFQDNFSKEGMPILTSYWPDWQTIMQLS